MSNTTMSASSERCTYPAIPHSTTSATHAATRAFILFLIDVVGVDPAVRLRITINDGTLRHNDTRGVKMQPLYCNHSSTIV